MYLIPFVADPSWSFVFGFHTWPPGPSAFRLSTQPLGPISLQASPLLGSQILSRSYECSCGTDISYRYSHTDSGFCHSQDGYPMVLGLYPYGFRGSYRECAQIPSVLQPSGSLAHYLEREVRSDRQVFQFFLVGTFSAQRFTTRFVQARCCQIFYSHFKSSRPGNLARRSSVKHCLLSVPPDCLVPLGCLFACLLPACQSINSSINGYEEFEIFLILFFLKLHGFLVFVPSTIFLYCLTCLHIPCYQLSPD